MFKDWINKLFRCVFRFLFFLSCYIFINELNIFFKLLFKRCWWVWVNGVFFLNYFVGLVKVGVLSSMFVNYKRGFGLIMIMFLFCN